MDNEIDLGQIDINSEPPIEEPARQYYFMAKCREWVREFERKTDVAHAFYSNVRVPERLSKQELEIY